MPRCASHLLWMGGMAAAVTVALTIAVVPSSISGPGAAPPCEYWVGPAGSDAQPGTSEAPWATLEHASEAVPDAGCTVWFRDGLYAGAHDIERRFTAATTFRAENPYRAVFEHSATVIHIDGARHVVLEGFEIRHSGPSATGYVVIVDQGDGLWAEDIRLRDNIIHDSYDNDLLKVHNGVQHVVIENNLLFNQGPREQHMDINGVSDVLIQDNIFFNDYAASGRALEPDAKHFIVVKDSGGDSDGVLGAQRISIRRNVLLNWQGGREAFVKVGNDGKPYFEAETVDVVNNLMIGNSATRANTAFGVAGARDVTFAHNTVVGDLPSSEYAFELTTKGMNPTNEDVVFVNNIWSDPTGTMGEFSDGATSQTVGLVLSNNGYWNGGSPIPPGDLVSPLVDDPAPVVGDPLLGAHQGVALPNWNGTTFPSGSSSIREEFVRLVEAYGRPAAGSVVLDAADPAHVPVNDILGNPRSASADLGAYEVASSTAGNPPVAIDDDGTTDEDLAALLDVAGNDVDPDGNLDPSSVVVTVGPDDGTTNNNGDGTVTYTPDADFEGEDTFTYRICDTDDPPLCDTALVTVTVNAVDDTPVATDDIVTIDQDTPVLIWVAGNDVDPDGNLDPSSVVVVVPAEDGTTNNNGDGTVTYTPDADFEGEDSFTYRICDTTTVPLCDTAQVIITVDATSRPPVANDDAAVTDEDSPVSVDVAGNDSDPDADLDPSTAATTIGPSRGVTVDNDDGTITYVPDADANGIDSFDYEICDATGLCDTAVVTVTVNPVDDPPVADDDAVSTDEEMPVLVDVAANDLDPDGDLDPGSVLVTVPPGNGTTTNHGDGTVTYSPETDFHGDDSFGYEICDLGGSCDSATVTVAVTPAAPDPLLYLSFGETTTLAGLADPVAPEDVVSYEPTSGTWALVLDASDVGISSGGVDAIHVRADGSMLVSFEDPLVTVPGLTGGPDGDIVTDADLVLFTPVRTGEDTAGSFSFYFDGSDVGLSRNGEGIDGLHQLPSGDLAISTAGRFRAGGVRAHDEDVVLFAATELGARTSGDWSLHFDGSDMGLNARRGDVDAVSFDGVDLILSTLGSYHAAGSTGEGEDVSRFTGTYGNATAGILTNILDLSAAGVTAQVDGVHVDAR